VHPVHIVVQDVWVLQPVPREAAKGTFEITLELKCALPIRVHIFPDAVIRASHGLHVIIRRTVKISSPSVGEGGAVTLAA
jgi:hypothetical protein